MIRGLNYNRENIVGVYRVVIHKPSPCVGRTCCLSFALCFVRLAVAVHADVYWFGGSC